MIDKTKQKKIRFTRAELKWIERTADIESARAMNRFTEMINNTKRESLSKEEIALIDKFSKELMELYLFLYDLRMKLELWDARHDLDETITITGEKHGNN